MWALGIRWRGLGYGGVSGIREEEEGKSTSYKFFNIVVMRAR